MAYVNQDPNAPPPAPRFPLNFPDFTPFIQRLAHPRLRTGCAFTLCGLLAGLVLLLALAPPYDGLAAGLDLQPARLLEPLRHYLFRNAVINTGILFAAVCGLALAIGWTWAVTGLISPARPFLLAPLFMPSALVGLLWRPLFAPWLDLAQMPVALTVTGLVLLWRAAPLAAWFFSRERDSWPKFMALGALLFLLDSTLVLTLTRGEPFNAAHLWPSWLFQQLWVSRAWGIAASMGGALALLLAALTWGATRRTPAPIVVPHGSPIGLAALLVWLMAPFIMPVLWWLQAPAQAISDLAAAGILRWLVNGAWLWVGTTLLARVWAWPLADARARRAARILTVTMLPITLVALAYLAANWPIVRGLWCYMLVTSLFTAGLLMGETTLGLTSWVRWIKAAGYAALVISVTFPLQIVLQLPPRGWAPALGITWTLAEASHATAALGLALLGFGVWAALGAWLLASGMEAPERERLSD